MVYEGRYFDGSHVYVMKGATGGGTGVDWANAYTTIGAAITAGLSPGDILHIATATLKTGTPPPVIDAEEFQEDVTFPKGILIIGHPGHGGSVGDQKQSHVRITGNTGVTGANRIVEVGEGSVLANVRLEARAHRSIAYFKFNSSSKLVNSSIGGVSYEDTVDCVLTEGGFIEFNKVGIGLNNIAATKVGIRAQSGLSLRDVSFGEPDCDCVMAEHSWVSLRDCVARYVKFGKAVLHVAEGVTNHTVKDNVWSGPGDFVKFDLLADSANCIIKNNDNIIMEAKPQNYLGVDNVAETLALITSGIAGKFKMENDSGDSNRLKLYLYDYEGTLLKTFYLKNPAGLIITTLLNSGAIVEREVYSP